MKSVFWLKIKLETLACWRRDMLSSLKAGGVYYIDLVNVNIPGDAFRLNRKVLGLKRSCLKSALMLKIKGKLLTKREPQTETNIFGKGGQRLQSGEMTS